MLKSILIPFLFIYAFQEKSVNFTPLASTYMNTPSIPESFKQTQKKNARVKQAYLEKEDSLKGQLKEMGMETSDLQMMIIATKQEREFQVYVKKKSEKTYQLFKTYDFCYLSGVLGPKRKEGDLQVPEGFYYVNWFNPNSQYHLSLKINYPNASDKILSDKKTPGGEIFIHGKCVSIGCIPLTDDKVNEVYILAVEATNNGQSKIPVYIFPFEMTDEVMILMEMFITDKELISFWKNLKDGYSKLLESKKELSFQVNDKGVYVF